MDLISIVNLVSTIGLLLLTWVMAKETQRLREAETEPEVSLYLDPNRVTDTSIDIVLKNNGRGAATNIKFSYADEALPTSFINAENLSDIPMLNGLPFLAPGQEIRCFFTDNLEIARNFAPKVTFTYTNKRGSKFSESTVLAAKSFIGVVNRAPEAQLLRWAIEEMRDKYCHKGQYEKKAA